MAVQMTTLLAGAQAVVFIVMTAINYVATSETSGAVPFTNAIIADSHPVYGLPAGWAFAVWGIIFLTLGLFTVYQVLPSKWRGGLDSELIAKIRLPVIGLEIFNATWIFLFGWELFWPALLVIVIYDSLLFVVIRRLQINYAISLPGMTQSSSVCTKLFVATPFSIHAGWVTVASVLNVQVNALHEGWLPSADFSVGLISLAVAIACTAVFLHADLPYALVSAWALGGIISNQSEHSTFGCVSRICAACTQAALRTPLPICERPNTASSIHLPNGWAGLNCSSWALNASMSSECMESVVPKSDLVLGFATVGIVFVLLAYGAGLVRACCISGMSDVLVKSDKHGESGKGQVAMTPDTTAAIGGNI